MENPSKELVFIQKDEPFTDSKVIAEATDNQHESVMRLIKSHKKRFERFGNLRFSDLKSGNPKGGRPTKICILNEPQATLLITFLDNNDIVADFKTELVHQFFQMRTFLMQKQTHTWEETRKQGKLTRNAETSVLKELVEYAEANGSKNANMLYITYTKLANRTVGVKSRDLATAEQLVTLEMVERVILNAVKEGISKGMEYH